MNRPYNEFYNIRRGDHWSPVFIFGNPLLVGRPRRPILLLNNLFRNQGLVGLTAVRSRCGSNTTLWCFSLPPRRFATLGARDSKSEVLPRVDCLSVCNDFIFDTFVRVLFGGVQGDLFREKGPPANLLNYSAK